MSLLHRAIWSTSAGQSVTVAMACAAIDELKAEPFDVSFDRTMSFRGGPGSRPFVLAGGDGLVPLKLFRRCLAAAFVQRDGLKHLGRRDFTPHVTLLFDDRVVDEQPIGPIGWTARDLVLIHSMKGHQHLANWPLRV